MMEFPHRRYAVLGLLDAVFAVFTTIPIPYLGYATRAPATDRRGSPCFRTVPAAASSPT